MKLLLINNLTRYLESLKKTLKFNEIKVINFNQISSTNLEEYDAIILSGSYKFLPNRKTNFSEEIKIIKQCNKPILGICFGFQLICHAHKCKLEKLKVLEKGVLSIKIVKSDKIFEGINPLKVYENHRWSVKKIKNLIPLAKSKDGIEIVRHPKKIIYGFQFHPEMIVKKAHKARLVKNFLNLCKKKV